MQTIKYKFADATTNEVEVTEKDIYQTAAYIALRQKDGPPMINVPLYVKVSEVNKNGMTEAQESVMHRVSEIMIKRNKKTIKRYHDSPSHATNSTAVSSMTAATNAVNSFFTIFSSLALSYEIRRFFVAFERYFSLIRVDFIHFFQSVRGNLVNGRSVRPDKAFSPFPLPAVYRVSIFSYFEHISLTNSL